MYGRCPLDRHSFPLFRLVSVISWRLLGSMFSLHSQVGRAEEARLDTEYSNAQSNRRTSVFTLCRQDKHRHCPKGCCVQPRRLGRLPRHARRPMRFHRPRPNGSVRCSHRRVAGEALRLYTHLPSASSISVFTGLSYREGAQGGRDFSTGQKIRLSTGLQSIQYMWLQNN